MLRSLVRISVVGLFVLVGVGFSLRLLAQQREGGLTPPPKPATDKVAAPATPGGKPFVVGERLRFNVSWSNFVTAARLELEVADRSAFFGQDGYQLRTKVETLGYVRSLFAEVDNQYTSYVDAQSLLPYRVENSTRQGLKQDDDSIIFDQARHTARFADGSQVSIPPHTYDLPSLIYALRLRELQPGASHKYIALYGKDLIEIEAQVKPRERVITQAGSYDALRVEFAAKSKTANVNRFRVRAWFSDDAQRLPVLITAQVPFGEVRADLAHAAISAPPKSPIATGAAPQTNAPLIVSTGRPPGEAIAEAVRRGELPPDFERGLPFAVGERLNYDASWLNLSSIGKISFEVRQQGRLGTQHVFEFVGEASTTGVARSILTLDDQFTCYARMDTLAPVRTDLRLREGKRARQVTAEYDPAKKTARLTNGTLVAIGPRTLDLLSLFYAVRAADLKIGSTHAFSFLDANHRLRAVTIKVIKQETIGGPLGPHDTLQLDIWQPDKQQLIAQAWLTNDARRLPIYIVAKPSFGELRLLLTSVTNIR
jgi:hypothetical protein